MLRLQDSYERALGSASGARDARSSGAVPLPLTQRDLSAETRQSEGTDLEGADSGEVQSAMRGPIHHDKEQAERQADNSTSSLPVMLKTSHHVHMRSFFEPLIKTGLEHLPAR